MEPVVVGVDGDRVLPSSQSIYQGEYARFLLVFDPVDFICNENDFTTSSEDVTVTMEEGADNVVRISVGEDIGAGSVVEVRFRGQLIMNVEAVPVRITYINVNYDVPYEYDHNKDEDLENDFVLSFNYAGYVPKLADFSAPDDVELDLWYWEDESTWNLSISGMTTMEQIPIYFHDQLIININNI